MDQPDTDPLKLFVSGYAALAQDQFSMARDLFQRGIAANTANLALNGNIALLVEAIDRQKAPETQPASETSSHFLLGAYQRQGTS
jgi:hypothetical protein